MYSIQTEPLFLFMYKKKTITKKNNEIKSFHPRFT